MGVANTKIMDNDLPIEVIIKRMDELSEYGVKNWSVALVGAAGLAAEIEQLGSVINRR